MQLPIYQVDAFSARVFGGNPAAVVPLAQWLPDDILQAIALENNLSETAYFVPKGDQFHLRWFTPAAEVRLCGHATLATAHTLFAELGYAQPSISFATQAGELVVKKTEQGYQMDFPADPPLEVPMPDLLKAAIDAPIQKCLHGLDDYMLLLESEEALAALQPKLDLVAQLKDRGLVVTAPGKEVDFVSRCFFPRHNIPEDPVTGSAHTMMTPFWAQRLGKKQLSAIQISARRGHLTCTLAGDRVLLAGQAQTFLRGHIFI
jgi:PhzF family phenazine biosynthesis protein